MLLVRQIFISPSHNYFGRYGQTAGTRETVEVDEAECVPGFGLKGDRFFGHRPDYKGQVTFFSEEVWQHLQAHFKVPAPSASLPLSWGLYQSILKSKPLLMGPPAPATPARP